MRQVLDYYFVLMRSTAGERREAMTVLKSLGVDDFVGALMWVVANVFENEDENHLTQALAIEQAKTLNCPLGIESDETRGQMLLEMILEGGNFGRSGEYAVTGGDHSAWWHFKRYVGRNSKLLRYYPSEIIWHLIMKLKI